MSRLERVARAVHFGTGVELAVCRRIVKEAFAHKARESRLRARTARRANLSAYQVELVDAPADLTLLREEIAVARAEIKAWHGLHGGALGAGSVPPPPAPPDGTRSTGGREVGV